MIYENNGEHMAEDVEGIYDVMCPQRPLLKLSHNTCLKRF